MSRRSRKDAEAPGQDSFLDVVANLVGILIILVMVVGAQVKVAWIDSPSNREAAAKLNELKASVQSASQTAAALELDNNEFEQKIETQQLAVAMRRAERESLQFLITAAQRQLDDKKQELSTDSQSEYDARRQLATARNELEDLKRQRNVIVNSAAPTAVIEHIPTPMAKTVFGKEVHFRLLGGRLVYVPMDELIERMQAEWRVKVEKLNSAPSTTETVGPIGDFYLRYQLKLAELTQQTQFGSVSQKVPQFEGFILIPASDKLGELYDDALRDGSRFRRLIDGLNPESTTITVWVYPDSYNEFLALKRNLFERGFLTASWPLPEGQPIAGSPKGRRSTAQ